MRAASVDLDIQALPRERLLEMVASNEIGGGSKLVCKTIVSVDMQLHIRHGSSLMLRNLKLLGTEQRARDLLLDRPILEALGHNT